MCGLVGMAGDVTGSWRDLFAQLLVIDSFRGIHSTGAGLVPRYFKDDPFVIKALGHPFNLLHSDKYDAAMRTQNSYKLLLGHNRYATIGAKTADNAHPFQFKDVMGAHNGTLDKNSVNLLQELYGEFGTDSETIMAAIQLVGIEKALESMSGAWALTWYDQRKNTINFLRSSQRPLHYCYSKDRCTLIWASELEMLKYIMNRSGKGDEKTAYFSATTDTHLSWEIPDSVNKKFDSPDQVARKGQNWIRSKWIGGNFSEASHGMSSSTRTTTVHHGISTKPDKGNRKKTQRKVEIREFANRVNTKKFRQPYKDPGGRIISKTEFEAMVHEGCALCEDKDQQWGKFVHLLGPYWGYHTPYVCEMCYNDEERYELVKYAI